MGLRLGTAICTPHICQHIIIVMQRFHHYLGIHGLSCKSSEGCHVRHAAFELNGIIQHSLSAARILSWLEPPGISRLEGKRPDGISLIHLGAQVVL